MKSATRYHIRTGACFTFALASLVVTSAVAVGTSIGAVKVPGLSGLGLGAEARADAAVREADASTVALATNKVAIDASPMNAAAWLRIAFIRSAPTGTLDATSIDGIRKSYSVAPFGPDVTPWRLQFLYGHWTQLPQDLRQEVMDEHLVYGRQLSISDVRLTDPAGRLAAVMMNGSVKANRDAAQIAAREKREKLPLA